MQNVDIALKLQDFLNAIFSNPNILLILALIISTAITLPFAVSLIFRCWCYVVRHRSQPETGIKQKKEEDISDDEKLPLGCFNSMIINSLYHFSTDGDNNDEDNHQSSEEKISAAYNDVSNITGENKAVDKTQRQVDQRTIQKRGKPSENTTDDSKKSEEKKQGVNLTDSDDETAKALKNLNDVGLHGKLATAHLHAKTTKIEQSMTDEERQKESDIRRQQLTAIFQMMQAQGNKFGLYDEKELIEQMKLYSV